LGSNSAFQGHVPAGRGGAQSLLGERAVQAWRAAS
jgi:hypothetical protein